jgi:hypothetical protein
MATSSKRFGLVVDDGVLTGGEPVPRVELEDSHVTVA